MKPQHVTLAQKVAFLSDPHNYQEQPLQVTAKETHMSWVFLTDHYAYKLKKPVKYAFLNFSTLKARYQDCLEEVRLNRRLAKYVYLKVVSLSLGVDGHLQLEAEGRAIEWLIKMRRLPEEMMLDYAIHHHQVPQDVLQQAALFLAQFFHTQPPVPMESYNFLTQLGETLEKNFNELASFVLPYPLKKSILKKQQQFLSKHYQLFTERIQHGHIKEAHGDLRPEHICLQSPPAIIDCLEFNAAFRTLDIADELAFFTIECEVLNAAWIPPIFWNTYADISGDEVPDQLRNFYKSYRAVLRALLAIRHLLEKNHRDHQHYLMQTKKYLLLAEKYVSIH